MSPGLLGVRGRRRQRRRAIAAAVQLARPSYECNFYLHNFKLILRLSHAQSQQGQREVRGGGVGGLVEKREKSDGEFVPKKD